jgi:hypothetical protein
MWHLSGYLKAPWERNAQFPPPELKGLPAWDPHVLTRTQQRETLLKLAAEQIDAYLDAMEHQHQVMGPDLRKPESIPKPEHFYWLVLYQVKRLSFDRIVETWEKRLEVVSRQSVTEAVRRTAKFLIGPHWKLWLRPRGKPGPVRPGRAEKEPRTRKTRSSRRGLPITLGNLPYNGSRTVLA